MKSSRRSFRHLFRLHDADLIAFETTAKTKGKLDKDANLFSLVQLLTAYRSALYHRSITCCICMAENLLLQTHVANTRITSTDLLLCFCPRCTAFLLVELKPSLHIVRPYASFARTRFFFTRNVSLTRKICSTRLPLVLLVQHMTPNWLALSTCTSKIDRRDKTINPFCMHTKSFCSYGSLPSALTARLILLKCFAVCQPCENDMFKSSYCW